MLRLRLVTTSEESHIRDAVGYEVEETRLLHGTQVLKVLVLPWANSDRVVCAESYFASVGAAEELKRIGLRFIGVVKTATRRYPHNALSRIELQQHGDFKGLTSSTNDGATCLHLVREYGVPFTKEYPVAIKFRLSRSIHTNVNSVAPHVYSTLFRRSE